MTHTTRIECLIFDLFGVLVAFDDRLVYDRIANRCQNPNGVKEKLVDLLSDEDLIRGRTSLKKLFDRIVEEHQMIATFSEFESLWRTSYSEPMSGIRDVLRQLSEQCRLVLLSNVDPFYWPTVRARIPELEGFHAKVLSFEQGIAKPETNAFERAVASSGVTVDRCLFVDDKPENVEAAAKSGLTGHVFQSCLILKEALRQTGFHIA